MNYLYRNSLQFILFLLLIITGALIYFFDLEKVAVPFISIFLGAILAFIFNYLHLKSQKTSQEKEALLKTKYLISKILIILEQMKKHIEHPDNIENELLFNWEKIKPYYHLFLLPDIEINNLMFLLQYSEAGSELLNKILLIDSGYQSLNMVLRERNHRYSLYLDKLANWEAENSTLNGPPQRDNASNQRLVKYIGLRLYVELDQFTSMLKKDCKDLMPACTNAIKGIDDFLSKTKF